MSFFNYLQDIFPCEGYLSPHGYANAYCASAGCGYNIRCLNGANRRLNSIGPYRVNGPLGINTAIGPYGVNTISAARPNGYLYRGL